MRIIFSAYSAANIHLYINRRETEEKWNEKGFSLKLHRSDTTTTTMAAFTKGCALMT
jgi:hypothetical protein